MIARPRRRPGLAPTRRPGRVVVVLAVVAVLLAITIGEIVADVENSSGKVTLIEERSFVAAVVPVVDESTALSSWLTEVRSSPVGLGRQGILAALGRLVVGAGNVRAAYESLGIPAPNAKSARLFAGMFNERVLAARTLTSAVTQALDPTGHTAALASMTQAAGDIARSDQDYLDAVQAVPPIARKYTVGFPKSSWAASADWSASAVQGFVTTLTSSAALAIRHDLTVVDVTLQPPVLRITPTTTTTSSTTSTTTTSTTSTTTSTTTLPGASTTSSTTSTSTTSTTSTSTTTTTLQVPPSDSTSWLAPTRTLQAAVVVANAGNTAESPVTLRATLTPVTPAHRSGTTTSTTTTSSSSATTTSSSSATSTSSTTSTTTAPKKRRHPLPPAHAEAVRRVIGRMIAGSSREIFMPKFEITPGTTYLLTVTISVPSGGSGQSDSKTVRVNIAG